MQRKIKFPILMAEENGIQVFIQKFENALIKTYCNQLHN